MTLMPSAVDVPQSLERLAVVDLGHYNFSIPRNHSVDDWSRTNSWDRWDNRADLRFSSREMISAVEHELLPRLIGKLEEVGRYQCVITDQMSSLDFPQVGAGLSPRGVQALVQKTGTQGVLSLEWIGLNVDQDVQPYKVAREVDVRDEQSGQRSEGDGQKPTVSDKEKLKDSIALKASETEKQAGGKGKQTKTVYDTYYDVRTRVTMQVLFRLYDGRSGGLLDEAFLGEVDESLQTLEYSPDSLFTQSEIASAIHINLFRIGLDYAKRISPHLRAEDRFLFTRIPQGDSDSMQRASRAVKEGQWDIAEATWMGLMQNASGEARARLLHNLAVSSEQAKRYDQAVEYARESLICHSMDKTLDFLVQLLEARENEIEAARQLGFQFEEAVE